MNAIILAAGMGTRLRPLTDHTPKALVKVNDKAMVERQIEYLNEIGISDILIVTGYLSEKFDYLKDKYGVKLIFNDKYDSYNNGYTMYLVREYLGDSLVLEGDVYLTQNFLLTGLNKSTYFSGIKQDFSGEWVLKFDENNKIFDIEIQSGTDYIMSGISYWNAEDGIKINKLLEEMVAKKGFKDLFWDDLIKDNLEDFHIEICKIQSSDWVEIDSLRDLKIAESMNTKTD